MPVNNAAWITASCKSPLEIKPSRYPTPGPRDVIVKAVAVAINPMDWKILDRDPFNFKYPIITGSDLAGVVVEVGTEATGLTVGDHIIAHCHGFFAHDLETSAFQEYVKVSDVEATRIPKALPFENAVVIPLAFETAIAGLFVPEQMNLSMSRFEDRSANGVPADSTIVIWGGSSSVGCIAIQLARYAGYQVVSTASPHNHHLCKQIGAIQVFDHASAKVEDEIVAALEGKTVVGVLDCIGDTNSTVPSCARILKGVNAKDRKVMSVLTPLGDEIDGIKTQRVMIPQLYNTRTYTVLHSWLVEALEKGDLLPKPDPLIVGTGLESIQKGIDLSRKGVSAKKLVAKL